MGLIEPYRTATLSPKPPSGLCYGGGFPVVVVCAFACRSRSLHPLADFEDTVLREDFALLHMFRSACLRVMSHFRSFCLLHVVAPQRTSFLVVHFAFDFVLSSKKRGLHGIFRTS